MKITIRRSGPNRIIVGGQVTSIEIRGESVQWLYDATELGAYCDCKRLQMRQPDTLGIAAPRTGLRIKKVGIYTTWPLAWIYS